MIIELYKRTLAIAHRFGRGADQGQAPSDRRAVGTDPSLAVSSVGDGEARGRGAAGHEATRLRSVAAYNRAKYEAEMQQAAVDQGTKYAETIHSAPSA
jgi:hypothetical protein